MVTAIVFSNLNVVSKHLVEYLVSKDCKVYVVSQNHKEWRENLPQLAKSETLLFFEDNRYLPRDAHYVFCVNGFGYSPENTYSESVVEENFVWAIDYANKSESKFAMVLPLCLVNDYQIQANRIYQKHKGKLPQKSFTFFLGEVYGKGMSLTDGDLATRMINQAIFNSVVTLPVENRNLYLIYVEDAIAQIIKCIFSFGGEEKEVVLTESDTAYNFSETLNKLKPNLSFVRESLTKPKQVEGLTILAPSKTTPEAIFETLSELSQYANVSVETKTQISDSEVASVNEPTSKKPKKAVVKKLDEKVIKARQATTFAIVSFVILAFIIFSPFLTLLISFLGLNYSYKQIQKGNVLPVKNIISISTSMATFSKSSLKVFTGIPLIGEFFSFSQNVSSTLELSGKVALEGIDLYQQASDLNAKILGDEAFDLVVFTDQTTKDLNLLQKDLNRLKVQIATLPADIRKQIPEEKLNEISRQIAFATEITPRLPVLLGGDDPKTYLMLFQNNMELRPTGGFIGSFALVTFNKGKLTDINVQDVYTADGQLKGHIEPPLPIKNYLGEANWFLRDSNWDPDFAVSAQRAEWFLEKEMERTVDGVIAIDLEVAKSILEVTGPITLTDFKETLDYKNMYDKIQYQVESDFFPGSTKKATLLTSFSKTLLERVNDINTDKGGLFAKSIFANLEQKHILLYLHDPKAQESLTKIGWSGQINSNPCKEINCQNAFLQINEANVGVNKANYFIDRTASLETKLENGEIRNNLTLTISNKGVPALGLKGRYKTYLRLIADKGAHFTSVEIKDTKGSKFPDLENEISDKYNSTGTLVEVQPGQTKTVVFLWAQSTGLNLANPGKFNLTWLRQPGVNPMTISASLTGERNIRYNTTLTKDQDFTLSW